MSFTYFNDNSWTHLYCNTSTPWIMHKENLISSFQMLAMVESFVSSQGRTDHSNLLSFFVLEMLLKAKSNTFTVAQRGASTGSVEGGALATGSESGGALSWRRAGRALRRDRPARRAEVADKKINRSSTSDGGRPEPSRGPSRHRPPVRRLSPSPTKPSNT